MGCFFELQVENNQEKYSVIQKQDFNLPKCLGSYFLNGSFLQYRIQKCLQETSATVLHDTVTRKNAEKFRIHEISQTIIVGCPSI